MNTFKRKALFAAVVAGLGVAGTAEAVFIAPNGTGQVLIYPYYTVQNSGTNSWNTYLSVVNTTSDAKVVKVRFLEGRASAEVLDFNLFLSPNDVWTAAIIPDSASNNSAGRIITADRSCTAPGIPSGGVAFRNFQFDIGVDLGQGVDRTREGYVEIIEMAALITGSATYDAITHIDGVPDDCSVVQVANQAAINADAVQPSGGLMGTGTLINVNSGLDAGYRADALDAFTVIANVTGPGDTVPSLQEAVPATSVVFNSGFNGGSSQFATVYRQDFAGGGFVTAGAQAVASVFMHESIMNEYVLDNVSDSLTDWVITQPVKRFFVDPVGDTVDAPYTELLEENGACEPIALTVFDREERVTVGGIDFSPPQTIDDSVICWETTVLTFGNGADHIPNQADPEVPISNVLGSRNTTAVGINEEFQNGWARMTFIGLEATATGLATINGESWAVGSDCAGGGCAVLGSATTFFGLPVTGFMVRTFANGGLVCSAGACQGNYASLFNHAYANVILP